MDNTTISTIPNVNVKNTNDLAKKHYTPVLWKSSSYPPLRLTNEEWNYIFDDAKNTFKTSCYVNFLAKKLNNMGIPCVLIADGKYDRSTVKLKCKHPTCKRKYKLFSILRNLEFIVLFDGELLHAPNVYTTRPLNGDDRISAMTDLEVMGTRKFDEKQREHADRNLTSNGNLDTIKSLTTYSHIKSVVLSKYDLDVDHIKDLSKLRSKQLDDVKHNIPGSEVYIQHVASCDFYVHSFSKIQIKILQQLLDSGKPITIHCDATGSIIKAPDGVEKRIYYYVLSVPVSILDEDRKILFPLLEMISSSHSAFTIGSWLGRFKDEFIKQVGRWNAPDHFVTDFSFAILNAASDALNREDLIDNVNRIFDKLHAENNTDETETKTKKTALHICCNHFSKTSAQDIDVFFPPAQASSVVRSFLKEAISVMFDMSSLDSLAILYTNLSTILNTKYITDDVKAAINKIASFAKEKDNGNSHNESNETGEENEEILEFDEDKDDAMYKESKFYKMFNRLTTKPNYDNKTGSLNNFYCPGYCDLLLRKYISILPLWTSISCPHRMSNANAESLFCIIKTRLVQDAEIIGRTPLRSSRFLRFTRQMINKWANQFWEQLPRFSCCNKKRERSTSNSPQVRKRSKFNTPKSALAAQVSQLPQNTEPVRTSPRPSYVTPKSARALRVTQLSQNTEPVRTSPRLSCVTPKSTRALRVTQLSQNTEPVRTSPRLSCVTPKSSRALRATQLSQNTESVRTSQRHITPKSDQTVQLPLPPEYCVTPRSSRPIIDESTTFESTPTSSSAPYIGDVNATEVWGPKRKKGKSKHSYFQFNLLKTIDSPKIAEQIFTVKDSRVSNRKKLDNNLIDDPATYFHPKSPFVVASVPYINCVLSNTDYKCLQPNQDITRGCIEFYLKLIPKSEKRRDTQLMFFETKELFSKNTKIQKINHSNVIGVLQQDRLYSLLIINTNKKVTAFVDPTLTYPTDQMLQNVLKYLAEHNEIYKTSYELQGWRDLQLKFPTLEQGNEVQSGVYILRFLNDLFTHNTISSRQFDVGQHRLTISHYILNKSAPMGNLCLLCGRKDDTNIKNPVVSWMKCEMCDRWSHEKCMKTTSFNIAYKCLLCA